MTTKDDGGPAFPTVAGQTVYSHGMTLRDWFAGQTVAGCAGQWYVKNGASNEKVAEWAYKLADAMLEARK